MSDKILVATYPDDTLLQGIRIAHLDLTEEQGQIVSNALFLPKFHTPIINYVWKPYEPLEWLFDKLYKSDLIIFNAESDNQTLVGWLAAQSNSYYFGTLKDLHLANDRAIYSVDDISTLLERISKNYEPL